MKNELGMTARQCAYAIACAWIHAAAAGKTGDVEENSPNVMYASDVYAELDKLHEKLLKQARLNYDPAVGRSTVEQRPIN